MIKTVVCLDIEGKEHIVPIHRLDWRPSVYGIIIKNKSVLLTKQYGGFDLPGGGVELGELLEEALKREVKEETGVDIKNSRLLDAKSNFFILPPQHGNKTKFIQSILLYFVCDYAGGALSIDGFDEHEKIHGEMPEWISLDQLDDIMVASSIDFRASIRKAAGL